MKMKPHCTVLSNHRAQNKRAKLHEWMRTQGFKIFCFHHTQPTLHGPVKTGFQLTSIGPIGSFCVYNKMKAARLAQYEQSV